MIGTSFCYPEAKAGYLLNPMQAFYEPQGWQNFWFDAFLKSLVDIVNVWKNETHITVTHSHLQSRPHSHPLGDWLTNEVPLSVLDEITEIAAVLWLEL